MEMPHDMNDSVPHQAMVCSEEEAKDLLFQLIPSTATSVCSNEDIQLPDAGSGDFKLDYSPYQGSHSDNVSVSQMSECSDNQTQDAQCLQCGGKIQWYFINYNKKLLMCPNESCHYPFMSSELHFEKIDSELPSDDESECSSVATTPTWSSVASFRSMDFEVDSVDDNLDFRPVDVNTYINSSVQASAKPEKTKLEMDLEMSSRLTNILYVERAKKQNLTNPYFLRNLLHLQKKAKRKLLTDEEMRAATAEDAQATLARNTEVENVELKIQLPSDNCSLPSIDFVKKT